jgi:hypothetical protein
LSWKSSLKYKSCCLCAASSSPIAITGTADMTGAVAPGRLACVAYFPALWCAAVTSFQPWLGPWVGGKGLPLVESACWVVWPPLGPTCW